MPKPYVFQNRTEFETRLLFTAMLVARCCVRQNQYDTMIKAKHIIKPLSIVDVNVPFYSCRKFEIRGTAKTQFHYKHKQIRDCNAV